MIHVALGILKNAKGDIFIAQRPLGSHGGGLWEFPGGKVEPGESAFAALKREFLEEVGIHIIKATPWFQTTYDYKDRHILLDSWIITEFTGEPHGAEGQPVLWVSAAQLNDFTFPAGNRVIIDRLL